MGMFYDTVVKMRKNSRPIITAPPEQIKTAKPTKAKTEKKSVKPIQKAVTKDVDKTTDRKPTFGNISD